MPEVEKAAYEAGLRPWDIGRMTPEELLATIDGYQRHLISAAWWQEYFSRQKHLKPLWHYLKPRKEQKPPEVVRNEYEELKARLL